MNRFLVYLGHLSYDSPGAESQCYPLNIGYLKTYALKNIGGLDIKLFMSPDNICSAIEKEIPNVVALSYYNWNTSLSDRVLRFAKKVKDNIITIGGGPNYPCGVTNRLSFWQERKDILNYYVVGEGELTFIDLLRALISKNGLPIECSHIDGLDWWDVAINTLRSNSPMRRIKRLDNTLPSPILDGTLDEFIQMKPMLQGVRGCPYSCAYCTMGSKYFNTVEQFSYERLVGECEYIKSHHNKYQYLNMTDDNFGMLKRDLKLIDYFYRSYCEDGWPVMIQLATPKGVSKLFINKAIEVSDMVSISMHFQSLNPETLKFIKRTNVSSAEIDELNKNEVSSRCLQSANTALIIPLPYETFDTYVGALRAIIDVYKIDQCAVHTLQLLDGTVFENMDVHDQFDFVVKYRIQAGYFGRFQNFDSVEIDKVCVGTNTFSEEEYYEARLLYCFCSIFCFKRNFMYIRKFIECNGLSVFDWVLMLYKNYSSAPRIVVELFGKFKKATREELFDSEKDLYEFWKNPDNRTACYNGESAYNISAMILGDMHLCYEDLLRYALLVTKAYFDSKGIPYSSEIDEIFSLMHHTKLLKLSAESINQDITEHYDHDYVQWEQDGFKKHPRCYYNPKKVKIVIGFGSDQKRDLINFIKAYADSGAIGRNLFYHRLTPSKYNRTIGNIVCNR